MPARNILILFFHPRFEDSRANKVMVEATAGLGGVTFRDMYEIYPDFNISVEQEKELLLRHDIIVWQHPFYWYNCPPLMKQWLDLVLEYGWAYGENGDKLSGKWVFNVMTTAGGFEAYRSEGRNRFTIRELLKPYDQTAYLCHMNYLPPLVIPGVPRLPDDELGKYGEKYRRLLRLLQQTEQDTDRFHQLDYFNDLDLPE